MEGNNTAKLKDARFDSPKSREELEKLIFPFMKNLYCHYSSSYDKERRNKINEECMQDFEKFYNNEGDYFQYPEAGEIITKSVALTDEMKSFFL